MENLFSRLVNSKEYFDKLKSKENIVCWGAGSKGRQTLALLKEKGIEPVAFCDNNLQLLGEYIEDVPIFNYEEIKRKYTRYCICVTCTLFNALEIYHMLRKEGEQNDIYFVSNPFKAENKFLDITEIESHYTEYEESYNALSDEESKKLFIDFLNWKITGDISITYKSNTKGWMEYFDEKIIPQKEDYCYIDVGAYTGDSICRFLAFVKGKYNHIIAFEPDDNNFNALSSFVKNGRLEKIELIKEGLWSREGERIFYTRGEDGIYESSNFFRDVRYTLCNNLLDGGDSNSNTVIVRTLDSYLSKYQGNNILLKIDALASEGEIIRGGGKGLIPDRKPVIVMEYGTHSEYIANVIPFLKKVRPDYRFYLRQHDTSGNSRTFIYAI